MYAQPVPRSRPRRRLVRKFAKLVPELISRPSHLRDYDAAKCECPMPYRALTNVHRLDYTSPPVRRADRLPAAQPSPSTADAVTHKDDQADSCGDDPSSDRLLDHRSGDFLKFRSVKRESI